MSGLSPRAGVRAIAAVTLVGFLLATANASTFSQSHLLDVRLPMLALGVVLSAPGWLLLILAARVRGAAWQWLLIAVAWGAFAAPFLAFIAEDALAPAFAAITSALAPLGRGVGESGPAAIIAPIAEEPAKAIGILIALVAIRRAGATLSVGLGAAIGALTGLAFSLTEVSHRLSEAVANSGYVDLNGVFVIDWEAVWRVEQVQLIARLFLFGLSDHAVFSALAGVAIVQLLRGRPMAAAAWFLTSLASHALFNSVGVWAGQWALGTLTGFTRGNPGLGFTLAAVWVASFAGFLVSQAWAVILLARAGCSRR